MRRLAAMLLVALLAAGAAILYATAGMLPPVVASHFDLAGYANGTLASIAASGGFLASLIAAFVIALHLLVVEANARTPPRIDSGLLWSLIAAFIIATLVWQFVCWQRFRRPR